VGGVKILWIPSSILTSDEEPPLDRGGGTERPRRRVMAAYAATPSHEKTYPSAAPPGTSLLGSESMAAVSILLELPGVSHAPQVGVRSPGKLPKQGK